MPTALAFNEPTTLDFAPDSPPVRGARLLPVNFPRTESRPTPVLTADHRRVLDAAISILRQGEDLLVALTEAQFAARVPVVFNGCIGGHYRHCLDHFTSLLRAVGADTVDYDNRDRDRRLETEARYALHVTRDLRVRLGLLTQADLAAEVITRCEVSYGHGDSPSTRSSFARELAYCIAHAIHHFALISVIAQLLDVKLPEHFGVAPSTVAYLARQAK